MADHQTMHANTDSPPMIENDNTEDIFRYLYQHTIYDEIPGPLQDEPHDHSTIYCHETDYIGHGIYKDLSKTMQLFNAIETSQSEAFIDTHLQSIVNIGCPQSNNDKDSLNEAYKEMYNAEQNEILQMNIESTIQRQKNL